MLCTDGSRNETFHLMLVFYVSLKLEEQQNSDINLKINLKIKNSNWEKKINKIKSENSNSVTLEFKIFLAVNYLISLLQHPIEYIDEVDLIFRLFKIDVRE